jgi:hypothetical protein
VRKKGRREGGEREGGRERGREGGREGRREGGRERKRESEFVSVCVCAWGGGDGGGGRGGCLARIHVDPLYAPVSLSVSVGVLSRCVLTTCNERALPSKLPACSGHRNLCYHTQRILHHTYRQESVLYRTHRMSCVLLQMCCIMSLTNHLIRL